MTATEWATQDELPLGTDTEVRQLRHGLSTVLIPRGIPRAEENQLRAALGVPQRPTRRKAST